MYEFHEIANVFPLLGQADLTDLAEDIRENGLLEPVMLFEGKILDGRNRYTACQTLGLEPAVEDFQGDYPAAVGYVVSKNLRRRNLTASQAAMCAERLATLGRGQRADLADSSIELSARSLSQAAETMGTTVSSVKRARTVRQQGIPELARLVDEGEVAVSLAAQVAKEPEDVQQRLVRDFDTEDAGLRKQAVKQLQDHIHRRGAVDKVFKKVDVFGNAQQAVRYIYQYASWLTENSTSLDTEELDLASKLADRIESGGSWIKSILSGGGINDADLAAWLEGEEGTS